MSRQSPTSIYFLTKEKKLEIHEDNQIFSSRIPLRFELNPLEYIKNLFLILIKSKKRLRSYTVKDQKDQKRKKIYLMHSEIQQVWNHPLKAPKTPIIKKSNFKQKSKKR